MHPTPCPVCAEPGGFHDQAKHAEGRRKIVQYDALALIADLGEEVGDGQALDDLLESLGQMARGEGRLVRSGEVRENQREVDDVQDRR